MRLKQLDVLRGIAIVLVLGRHLPYYEKYTGIGDWFFKLWEQVGWIGVDLFFVLSGFLVSGLLFKEYQSSGKINLRLFLIRRGFKIYPAYYLLILCTIVFYFFVLNHTLSAKVVWVQLLFLQNYSFLLWGHTWSLAVEEHFYFLIGLFLLICSKKKLSDPFKVLTGAFFFVAIACLMMRLLNFFYGNGLYAHTTHLFPTHLRIDSLMFGVYLSYLHHFHFLKIKQFITSFKDKIIFISCLLILPVLLFELEKTPFIYTFGLTMLYVGFGGMLMVFLYCVRLEGGIFDLLAKIGFNSYSIYIWHIPIVQWVVSPMVHFTGTGNFGLIFLMVLYLFLAVSLGIVMARLVEIPFLNYRDKAFSSVIN